MHEHVEAAEPLADGRHRGARGAGVAQIRGVARDRLIVQSCHRVVADVDDRDRRTGGREPVDERATDRAPTAGDQHALAG